MHLGFFFDCIPDKGYARADDSALLSRQLVSIFVPMPPLLSCLYLYGMVPVPAEIQLRPE